jgi:pimeloyl-ACP methyl ester carboxylesterase
MKQPLDPADCIQPLYINGLNGRVLRAPSLKADRKREMLLIYGHHAMLERWWGLVQNLQEFGSVTMPDLPGFGGMDSFYKIGKKPTIDSFADYLAAFVKMRYKHRRVTILGISFGFVVVTRMLQRYPELADKVDLVVSIVGFMHRDDFLFPPKRRVDYHICTRIMSTWLVAPFIRYGWQNSFAIRQIYVRMPAGKRRKLSMGSLDFKTMMNFEVKLWHVNDTRTHWYTTSEFLDIDNCKVPIKLPVWHVASKGDHYFNNHFVEQHMRVVFNDYHQSIMHSEAHTPSIIGTKKDLAVMIPASLRRELRKNP